MINTKLEGNDLPMKVIVVTLLTMEAILGLELLVKMEAEIVVMDIKIRFRNGDWRSVALLFMQICHWSSGNSKIPPFSKVTLLFH